MHGPRWLRWLGRLLCVLVALRLLEGGGRVSLDGAGTLERWQLPPGALEEAWSFESLAATQGSSNRGW